jgi:hypothetical protein
MSSKPEWTSRSTSVQKLTEKIGATVDLGAGLRPRPSAHQHRLLNAADGSGLIEQGAHRRADAVWPTCPDRSSSSSPGW